MIRVVEKELAAERAAHAETREKVTRLVAALDRETQGAGELRERAEKAEAHGAMLQETLDVVRPAQLAAIKERDALRASLAQAVEVLYMVDASGALDMLGEDSEREWESLEWRQFLQGAKMAKAALTAARKLLEPEVGTVSIDNGTRFPVTRCTCADTQPDSMVHMKPCPVHAPEGKP